MTFTSGTLSMQAFRDALQASRALRIVRCRTKEAHESNKLPTQGSWSLVMAGEGSHLEF